MTRRALELAAEGIGLVSPSPLVGCVVVDAAGATAGEGAYIYEKLTHAEVIALRQAGERARGGTAYVSLEPHAHVGRTPPCTEALIKAGIRRVVCPIEDPNPLVSGKGFEILRAHGVEVATGLLREEAARLNEKFCVWHHRKRPFVHLKLATSIDGRISASSHAPTRLTGDETARRVQLLRHEYDAILVGANTALVDDPHLTDRSGQARRRPLVRVVLDNRLRIALDSVLAKTARDIPTLVFSNSADEEKIERLAGCGVEVARIDARALDSVLEELRQRELQSVLIEGGRDVAGSFCDARLVDKFTFLLAPIVIGGERAPSAIGGRGPEIGSPLALENLQMQQHGRDFEVTGYPQY